MLKGRDWDRLTQLLLLMHFVAVRASRVKGVLNVVHDHLVVGADLRHAHQVLHRLVVLVPPLDQVVLRNRARTRLQKRRSVPRATTAVSLGRYRSMRIG